MPAIDGDNRESRRGKQAKALMRVGASPSREMSGQRLWGGHNEQFYLNRAQIAHVPISRV